MILNDKAQYEKYEDFMVRRVLAVYADTRWCPAPDCRYTPFYSVAFKYVHTRGRMEVGNGDIFMLRKKC
jgi:hypothetical protein